MDQLHMLFDIVSPIVIVAWVVVGLMIKGSLSTLHNRLAIDKADLVKNQTDVKEALVNSQAKLGTSLEVHVAKDELIQAQILEQLKEIKNK